MSGSRARMARWAGVLMVLALLLAACGGGEEEVSEPAGTETPAAMETESPPETEPAPEPTEDLGDAVAVPPLSMVDNSFAPSSLDAVAGQEVTIEVTNTGQNPHTFTIDELMVDTGIVDAGDTATVTFTMPDTDVEFYCTVHGRAIMSGTISGA